MVQVANSLPMFLFAHSRGRACGYRGSAPISDLRRIRDHDHLDRRSRRSFGFISSHRSVSIAVQLHRDRWFGDYCPGLAGGGGAARVQNDLPAAVAANSVGINVSRAVGPAIGGILVGAMGIAAPFWVNAFSNVGVIAALIGWRPPRRSGTPLPPGAFGSAIRTGLRHARYNRHLSATLIRATAILRVCQRLLGAVAARRTQPDRRRPCTVRNIARRHRRLCRRRCVPAAMAQGEIGRRPAGLGRHPGHLRWRPGCLRSRTTPLTALQRASSRAPRGSPPSRASMSRRKLPCRSGCAAAGSRCM